MLRKCSVLCMACSAYCGPTLLRLRKPFFFFFLNWSYSRKPTVNLLLSLWAQTVSVGWLRITNPDITAAHIPPLILIIHSLILSSSRRLSDFLLQALWLYVRTASTMTQLRQMWMWAKHFLFCRTGNVPCFPPDAKQSACFIFQTHYYIFKNFSACFLARLHLSDMKIPLVRMYWKCVLERK